MNEWMSVAEGWVGDCVDLVTHRSSYFGPSSPTLSSPSTSVAVKRYRWAVHPPVSLLQCLTHQFIITVHWRCNCGWGDSVQPDSYSQSDTNQLCFLPSLSVLLHQQIADWLHKVLEKTEKKFHMMPHSFSLRWSLYKTQLATVCILILGFKKRPICATQSFEKIHHSACCTGSHVCSISFWLKPT